MSLNLNLNLKEIHEEIVRFRKESDKESLRIGHEYQNGENTQQAQCEGFRKIETLNRKIQALKSIYEELDRMFSKNYILLQHPLEKKEQEELKAKSKGWFDRYRKRVDCPLLKINKLVCRKSDNRAKTTEDDLRHGKYLENIFRDYQQNKTTKNPHMTEIVPYDSLTQKEKDKLYQDDLQLQSIVTDWQNGIETISTKIYERISRMGQKIRYLSENQSVSTTFIEDLSSLISKLMERNQEKLDKLSNV